MKQDTDDLVSLILADERVKRLEATADLFETKVTLRLADGAFTTFEDCMVDGAIRQAAISLGLFVFEKDPEA